MSDNRTGPTFGGQGEKQAGRQAMDRLTEGLIKSGMDGSAAREKAREVAIRNDRGEGAKRDPRDRR